ncbi:MAG: ABC transporter permease [Ferrovum sp.]|nr:ABC transporter permease [Ferrovum sp.]
MTVQIYSSMRSENAWSLALRRLWRDPVGRISLGVVVFYLVLVGLVLMGWLGTHWNDPVAVNYAPPTWYATAANRVTLPAEEAWDRTQVIPLYGWTDPLEPIWSEARAAAQRIQPEPVSYRLTLPLGADKWGRDVGQKVLKGTQTSVWVGLVAAFVATFIGTVLGALAGYYGRGVDDLLNGFYGVLTSIPYLLLVFAVAAVFQQKEVGTLILILGLTGWTGVFRLVRAEYLKHRTREYVLAAGALGASHGRRVWVHILPNVSHVVLVQFSQNLVGFIKSEVILSFLGFGVPVSSVSWGSMLNEAQNELILGKWWQLVVTTVAMAIFVTALSLLTDALRDALDPRLNS